MKYTYISFFVSVTGCAGTEAIRTSQNSAIVKASAAPACGGLGAARVAQAAAASETIRAGYDRYIITGSAEANNVTVTQLPGTVNTYGSVTYGGGYGSYRATSFYSPGSTVYSG